MPSDTISHSVTRYDLNLEDSKQFFSTRHSGSWCCITIPSLVMKCSEVQKILSGQTFTGILNLSCDLDPEHSNPIFLQNTPVYDAKTKFGCKQTSNLEDKVEIIIFWLYKPSLWPWHCVWRSKTANQFFCITLWLKMLHYHTKSGIKMIYGSEDIIQTQPRCNSLRLTGLKVPTN